MSILEVSNLRVRFETHHGIVRAVDGVSFTLEAGETLGLVGESGSGKSVTNLALMGLVPSPPGVVESEGILLDGRNLSIMSERELRKVRGNEISMIFQDPMTSLNPYLTVGQQLVEVLEIHKKARGRKARKRCVASLADVGIPEPERRLEQYPHELSGGMRQRVMIAMALLCEPKVLLADEPTTALDVTIQAQILDLMTSLQERHGTAIILVTHDLGVVAGMSDRVHVMYAGRLVETGSTMDLFARPAHPYTRGLLESVPRLVGDTDEALQSIPGQPPDLADLPPGCAFLERCDVAVEQCAAAVPELERTRDREAQARRQAACFVVPQEEPGALEETVALGVPGVLKTDVHETVNLTPSDSARAWIDLRRSTRGEAGPEDPTPEPDSEAEHDGELDEALDPGASVVDPEPAPTSPEPETATQDAGDDGEPRREAEGEGNPT